MNISLSIVSATRDSIFPSLIRLVFNDGTQFAVMLGDGSARCYAHDLLDVWLAEGNAIANPAP